VWRDFELKVMCFIASVCAVSGPWVNALMRGEAEWVGDDKEDKENEDGEWR
jgi:hypothetical protein